MNWVNCVRMGTKKTSCESLQLKSPQSALAFRYGHLWIGDGTRVAIKLSQPTLSQHKEESRNNDKREVCKDQPVDDILPICSSC